MSSNIDKKIEVVKKIGEYSNIIKQLRSNPCITVEGNPVSIVPIFILEMIYALGWKAKPFGQSLTDVSMVSKKMGQANVCIVYNKPNSSENMVINSEWSLDKDMKKFSVDYEINGQKQNEEINFNNDKERIPICSNFLTSLIEKSLK